MKKVYTEQRRMRLKVWSARAGATAAVLVCGVVFCVSNPTMAAKLPLIGHIFERMQDDFSYPGDYSGLGEKLGEETDFVSENETDAANENSSYTKTVGGLTVTLSEMYCNSQALYITMQMKSREAFPEISAFKCDTVGKYSYAKDDFYSGADLEGEFIDEYTYAGLLRIDLNGGFETQDGITAVTTDIPDSFLVELSINQIVGSLTNTTSPDFGKTKEELEAMSDEEWEAFMIQWAADHPDYYESQAVFYNGPWTFSLDVQTNMSDMQVVEINDYNERGVGFSRVVKDRFEITMYDSYTDFENTGTYFPVMLDADGKMMDTGGGGWVNTVAIDDHDVSTIDLFLIDDYLWLDKLKGIYWNNPNAETYDGKTFKEILLENCEYHTVVSFENSNQ